LICERHHQVIVSDSTTVNLFKLCSAVLHRLVDTAPGRVTWAQRP
jgi:kynureninase